MTSHSRVVGTALLVAAFWMLSEADGFAVGLSPVQQCGIFIHKVYNVCLSTPTAVPDPRTKAQFCTGGLGAGLAKCSALYGKGMRPTMMKPAMKRH